jgi:hypothetical protein
MSTIRRGAYVFAQPPPRPPLPDSVRRRLEARRWERRLEQVRRSEAGSNTPPAGSHTPLDREERHGNLDR